MNNIFHDKSNTKPIVLICIISVMLFLNTLKNDFTYDDLKIVEDNPFMLGQASLKELLVESRVIRTLSLMVDYKLFGFNPWGYHLQNIFWHALSTVLVYFFALRLSGDRMLSIVSSVLFASHPVHVEAVANISNRKDVLCLAFSLTAVLFYFKAYDYTRGWRYPHIAFSIVAFLLAALSKQTAVVIPVLLLAYELFFIQHGKKRFLYDNLRYILPLGFAFIIYGIIYIISALDGFFVSRMFGNLTYNEFLLTSIKSFLLYNNMILFPVNMSADHVFPISKSIFETKVLLALLELILLMSVILKFRSSKPLLSYSILWYLISLAPVMSIPGAAYFMAERYLYIPSVGFALFQGLIFNYFFKRKYISIIFILVIIIVLNTINTINRNTIWENGATLWADTIFKDPDSITAHSNIAKIYNEGGEPEKAIPFHLKVLEVMPDDYGTQNYLGVAYEKLGDYDMAIKSYEKVLKIKPDYSISRRNIASLKLKKGLYTEAHEDYQYILRNDPKDVEVYFHLGVLYTQTGEKDKAVKAFEQFLERWKKDRRYSDITKSEIARLKGEMAQGNPRR